jgi:hypothetical protein
MMTAVVMEHHFNQLELRPSWRAGLSQFDSLPLTNSMFTT